MNILLNGDTVEVDASRPTVIFREGEHAVYWLGVAAETAFRCNTYLITDGEEMIIVDPGNSAVYPEVRRRVEQIAPAGRVSALVVCHQDPDVAASIREWLEFNPGITIITSPRTEVLLPHFGVSGYRSHDIEAEPEYRFASGRRLRFYPAPFLHSPMAFTTYDASARYLFTGDIFAAIESDWSLVVEEFEAHRSRMDLFHIDYMASNAATHGFVRSLEGVEIDGLLPQHGSLIPRRFVAAALEYLDTLHCGTDVLYPDL